MTLMKFTTVLALLPFNLTISRERGLTITIHERVTVENNNSVDVVKTTLSQQQTSPRNPLARKLIELNNYRLKDNTHLMVSSCIKLHKIMSQLLHTHYELDRTFNKNIFIFILFLSMADAYGSLQHVRCY